MADYGFELDKYSWTQSEDGAEVIITFDVPESTTSRDIEASIKVNYLKFCIKGQDPILDGKLGGGILTDESTWTKDENHIEFTLTKDPNKEKWWEQAIVGEGPKCDPKDIEGSKYVDASLLKRLKAEKAQKEKEDAEAKQKQEEQEQEEQKTEE